MSGPRHLRNPEKEGKVAGPGSRTIDLQGLCSRSGTCGRTASRTRGRNVLMTEGAPGVPTSTAASEATVS